MSRILIIEDDRAIALGLRLNLRRDGHEVRIAQDGETGLRMALEPDVDLNRSRRHASGPQRLRAAQGGAKAGFHRFRPDADRQGHGERQDPRPEARRRRLPEQAVRLGELLARVEALLRRRPAAPERAR